MKTILLLGMREREREKREGVYKRALALARQESSGSRTKGAERARGVGERQGCGLLEDPPTPPPRAERTHVRSSTICVRLSLSPERER